MTAAVCRRAASRVLRSTTVYASTNHNFSDDVNAKDASKLYMNVELHCVLRRTATYTSIEFCAGGIRSTSNNEMIFERFHSNLMNVVVGVYVVYCQTTFNLHYKLFRGRSW